MKSYEDADIELLKENNNFYKKLLFQSPDLIFQFTLTSQGAICFSFLSKSVVTHFDLTSKEKDKPALEILKSRIIPADFESFIASIYRSKIELKNWVHEFRGILPLRGLR